MWRNVHSIFLFVSFLFFLFLLQWNANFHAMVSFVQWFSCSKFIHFEWSPKTRRVREKKRSNHKSAQNNGNVYHCTCFYFHGEFHIFRVQNVGIFRILTRSLNMRWFCVESTINAFSASDSQWSNKTNETHTHIFFSFFECEWVFRLLLMCSLSII